MGLCGGAQMFLYKLAMLINVLISYPGPLFGFENEVLIGSRAIPTLI